MSKSINWNDWDPVDKDLEHFLQPGMLSRLQPHHPLMKLKRNLLINMVWSLLITIFYLVLMLAYPAWPVVLTLVICSCFNIMVVGMAWKLYRGIRAEVSGNTGLLQELKQQHSAISKWGRIQLKLALFVYPIAAAGGYILGGILGSQRSISELMEQRLFVWVMPLAILTLVPLSYWLAKWLFSRSFGRHLAALKENIDALEAE